MGNYEQLNCAYEFDNGIRNLISVVAGNTCKYCSKNFIPNRKNDEICDDCLGKAYNSILGYRTCRSCGSSIICGIENCCEKCFEKHKRICSRCGEEHILYQNNKCEFCHGFP